MSHLAVKYHNDLNQIPFRSFNAVEMDLFFTILASIKDEGVQEVVYSFSKIRELSKYTKNRKEDLVSDLEDMIIKLNQLIYKIEDGSKLIYFTLFPTFIIDKDNQTLTIEVHKKFEYIMNNLNGGNFTVLQLKEIVSLKSTYSKTIYRLLNQFAENGRLHVAYDDFKKQLDIPDSYDNHGIKLRILEQAKKELKPYFKNLTYKEIRNGRKLVRYDFFFKPDSKVKEEEEKRISKENYEKRFPSQLPKGQITIGH